MQIYLILEHVVCSSHYALKRSTILTRWPWLCKRGYHGL